MTKEMLLFLRGKLRKSKVVFIENHLRECEFCAAEAQLLATYPPPRDEFRPAPEMPLLLRRFAESHLRFSYSRKRLSALLNQNRKRAAARKSQPAV